MQKLLDAAVDYPLILPAANEDFEAPHAADFEASDVRGSTPAVGWNAFEIWRSRILPGVTRRYLPSP